MTDRLARALIVAASLLALLALVGCGGPPPPVVTPPAIRVVHLEIRGSLLGLAHQSADPATGATR